MPWLRCRSRRHRRRAPMAMRTGICQRGRMSDLPKARETHSPVEPRGSIPHGVWVKCVACREILFARELARNGRVCPHCGDHGAITGQERLQYVLDPGSLKRISKLQPVVGGVGRIEDQPLAISIFDTRARDGAKASKSVAQMSAMASVAVREKLPYVACVAAGCGLDATSEMANDALKLHAMVRLLSEIPQPYILIITDPTPAYGHRVALPLGDVVIVEAPTGVRLSGPEGADSGDPSPFADMFLPRTQLTQELAKLLAFFAHPRTGDGERTS